MRTKPTGGGLWKYVRDTLSVLSCLFS